MCYFFSLAENEIKLQQRYNAHFEVKGKFKGEDIFNGFTHPEIPIISNENPNLFRFFHWGLIPKWTKSRNEAMEIRKLTLNARIETMFEKPFFALSAKYHRCLVPVNGFFEWQHQRNQKIKYYIRLADKEIFSLGGIWSEWIDTISGEIIRTFSIVTMQANPLMARIHNTKKRMPVILVPEYEFEWLRDDLKSKDLNELANFCTEDRMRAVQFD